MTAQRGVSAEIDAYLLEHYPCQALPHGPQRSIALMFGVSHTLVYLRAQALGMGRIKHQKPVRLCECGEPLVANRKYCDACRVVPVSCSICGSIRNVPRGQFIRNASIGAPQSNHCGRGTPCAAESSRRARAKEASEGRGWHQPRSVVKL